MSLNIYFGFIVLWCNKQSRIYLVIISLECYNIDAVYHIACVIKFPMLVTQFCHCPPGNSIRSHS